MWDPDLPWVPIYIFIASIKGINGYDFLDFAQGEVVFKCQYFLYKLSG